MKRPRSPFAPPEIELPEPLFTALCHQIPVHEIIRGIFVILGQRPTVIGQYLVSKVKTEHSRNRRLALAYPEQPGLLGKLTSDRKSVV